MYQVVTGYQGQGSMTLHQGKIEPTEDVMHSLPFLHTDEWKLFSQSKIANQCWWLIRSKAILNHL